MANPRIESLASSLERELAKERATLLVDQSVEAIIENWDEFASQPSDEAPYSRVLSLMGKLRIDTESLPTWPAAIIRLESCLRKGETPRERHLTHALAPWTSRF